MSINNYKHQLDKSVSVIEYRPDEVNNIVSSFSGKEIRYPEEKDVEMENLINLVFGEEP